MRRLDWKLRRRIEARKIINKKYMVNELVADLQSNFPEYRRLKNFSKRVQQTLESLENPPLQKKRKKVDDDDKEEQILLHCRTTSTSSFSTISEDEDAITQEPGFDVTKSLLQSSYSCCSKENVSAKSVQEEKSLEMEVDSKANNKILDFMEVGDTHRSHKRKMENANNKEDYVRQEELVKRKDNGPRFKDLGGIEKVLDQLMMEVIMPFYHPQLPHWLGVKPVSGILFHGPPGCGKTVLARAIANEIGVPFYQISATEVVSGVSGASEENIRDLFSKAHRTAPSIVFIDEIDAIASKRESLQREMERRIVTQLMTCMDESHQHIAPADADPDPDSGTSGRKPGYVLVIGATNRPDALDPALRRPGRFDREILLGVPDEKARAQILSVVTSHSRLEGAFDIDKLARSTPGFVGADLASLANTAGNLAIRRAADRRKSALSEEAKVEGNKEEWWRRPWTPEELESLNITMADYEEAIKMVQPSSRREGFSTIPNVKWEDVGGLDLSRKEFDRYIVNHIKHREDYAEFGVDLEMGILLYGPPGCGKTLIAKAVANEAGANFIYIKGPEVLDPYVGQSEMNVRTIFTRARACAPCILFFDEVDALTTKRGKEGVVERVLNQLLIELDGAGQRQGVYVIGATNRPEVMDPAVLRPGRFGKLLYVPLPGPNERCLILKALAQKKPIDEDVDLTDIGRREACENLSGSDLAKLMNEAALAAMEEKQLLDPGSHDMRPWTIKERHFDQALKKVEPSVTAEQRNYYENLSRSFGEA